MTIAMLLRNTVYGARRTALAARVQAEHASLAAGASEIRLTEATAEK
jgi:hypothetical protein